MVKNLKLYTLAFFKWLLLSLIMGAVAGVLGGGFSIIIEYVTGLRGKYNWLLYLLPIGGLLSVFIFKLCKVADMNTNTVFESVRSKKAVSVLLAPAIFIGSVITHLFGGSAGREGAALQLGGSISTLVSKIFKLKENSTHVLTVCGMSGFFSAVFGTPIGASVFAIEVVTVGKFSSAAVFPAFITAITAKAVSALLGAKGEAFTLSEIPDSSIKLLLSVLIIAVETALVSILFCKTLHFSEKIFKKYISNNYLRIFAGGLLIVALTLIVGNTDYNGGGIAVIERIFKEGSFRYEAFLLKMLFTAITIGAGFKGGEIVPTIFIGATFGAALGSLLGLSAPFAAAIGLAAMFCGVTNCPIASIFLSIELFGSKGLVFFALACAVSFLISGNVSLYSAQQILYSKLNDEVLSD